jgi:plasmid stability protein
MATLTLKNVPDELYGRLKRQAERNARSLNREAIQLLSLGLMLERPEDPEVTIERLRRFRETLPEAAQRVTVEEIDAFINEGRD